MEKFRIGLHKYKTSKSKPLTTIPEEKRDDFTPQVNILRPELQSGA